MKLLTCKVMILFLNVNYGYEYNNSLETDEAVDISFRIVGGTEVETIYPYMVSIQFMGNRMLTICGGSIIAPYWVLTAAHCLINQKNRKCSTAECKVIRGTLDLKPEPGKGDYRLCKCFHIHSDYYRNKKNDDIALVNLEQPFNNKFVLISTKPETDLILNSRTRPKCIIMGWGFTQGGKQINSNKLLKADVQIFSGAECRKLLTSESGLATEKNLCVMDTGKSACNGDSGGPLICNERLFGVASWNPDKECSDKNPTVYIRADYYTNWIRNTMNNISNRSTQSTILHNTIIITTIFQIILLRIIL